MKGSANADEIPRSERSCQFCQGTGIHMGGYMDCLQCEGTGKVYSFKPMTEDTGDVMTDLAKRMESAALKEIWCLCPDMPEKRARTRARAALIAGLEEWQKELHFTKVDSPAEKPGLSGTKANLAILIYELKAEKDT